MFGISRKELEERLEAIKKEIKKEMTIKINPITANKQVIIV